MTKSRRVFSLRTENIVDHCSKMNFNLRNAHRTATNERKKGSELLLNKMDRNTTIYFKVHGAINTTNAITK